MSAETYLWFKWLHIVAAMLFVGNIIVTAWWKYAADKTKNTTIIAFAVKQVMTTDKIFTFPSVLLIFGFGMGSALVMGAHASQVYWIAMGLSLFTASGLLWFIALLPIQLRMRTITMHLEADEALPEHYWKLSLWWNIIGSAATLLPLIATWYMVFKPL